MSQEVDQYEFVQIQFSGGSESIPNATVVLRKDGQTLTDAAPGPTVIQAGYNAVERIIGVESIVVGWNPAGRDVARLVLREGNTQAVGVARDEDINIASIKAFVVAVNDLLQKKAQQQAVATSA